MSGGGYLRADPRDKSRLRRTQKAVDVQLAVDALAAAADRIYECAIFLTGDGDLSPAVVAVSNRGILTAVCGPKRSMSEVLARAADRLATSVSRRQPTILPITDSPGRSCASFLSESRDLMPIGGVATTGLTLHHLVIAHVQGCFAAPPLLRTSEHRPGCPTERPVQASRSTLSAGP